MRLLKQLFTYIALILILGGAGLVSWQYIMNKRLFAVLLNSTNVRESMDILRLMAYGAGAVVLGLVCLVIALKFGSVVRRNEREKREALKAQEKENEILKKQLKKEAEEAKAEAEKAKEEIEKLKQSQEVEESKEEA